MKVNSLFIVIIIFVNSCSVFKRDHSRATALFVHGAHFTANSWKPLMEHLPYEKLSAVSLPGRNDSMDPNKVTLKLSAQYLCEAMKKIEGKIVVVAHSQGGAVVNQSIGLCPEVDIKSILYVAAVVPMPQEKPFDLLSKIDEKNYFSGIKYRKSNGLLIIKNKSNFLKTFASDAHDSHRKTVLKTAVPEPAKLADGVLSFDRNRLYSIPKYYVLTTKDKIIEIKSQKKIVKRLKFKKIFALESGHLPMITKSYELAGIVEGLLK